MKIRSVLTGVLMLDELLAVTGSKIGEAMLAVLAMGPAVPHRTVPVAV